MTKKNTTSKVPKTKIAPPKVIPLTKSQKELFTTKRNAGNQGLQVIIDKFNEQFAENLGKLVDTFVEELGINAEEDWTFDANTLKFKRTEKKE